MVLSRLRSSLHIVSETSLQASSQSDCGKGINDCMHGCGAERACLTIINPIVHYGPSNCRVQTPGSSGALTCSYLSSLSLVLRLFSIPRSFVLRVTSPVHVCCGQPIKRSAPIPFPGIRRSSLRGFLQRKAAPY